MKIANNNININISPKSFVNAVLIVGLIALLFKLSDLVLVVLTSIVIASFARIASQKLARYRIPKTLSVLSLYVVGFAILSGIFYFFIPVLIVELSKLLPLIAEFFPGAFDGTTAFDAQSIANSIADGAVLPEVIEQLRGAIVSVSSGFLGVISNLFGNIANVVLIIVLSFYLSLADDGIESFLKIITPKRNEAYVIGLWHRSQKKIAYWMRGQMMMGLIVGLLTFIGLTLIGVEYALLLVVMAGVFEIVPFGIVLAAIPAISLAFASGGFSLALIVSALYVGIQQLEGYVLQPLIVRKVTGISPIAVMLSVLIGFKLAGFWGLVLAIPVAVTILEYIHDREKKKVMSEDDNEKNDK